ncbi:unnamed protein product [Strongylus vulgaris]|uniref:Uncharacterized protein n=1 Tax=Strongylus vulgaris TaxID=40348 RepID=A0A3P7IDF9_STRVU|nr:unnamed protein product [Strongylus vulgaris]
MWIEPPSDSLSQTVELLVWPTVGHPGAGNVELFLSLEDRAGAQNSAVLAVRHPVSPQRHDEAADLMEETFL